MIEKNRKRDTNDLELTEGNSHKQLRVGSLDGNESYVGNRSGSRLVGCSTHVSCTVWSDSVRSTNEEQIQTQSFIGYIL